jgi:hypothetical protein
MLNPVVPGGKGLIGKKRERKLAKLTARVFELREQGKRMEDIAKEIGTKIAFVKHVLFSKEIRKDRLDKHMERMVSLNNMSIDLLREKIEKDKDEKVAMWLLEKTGVASKEAVAALVINAHNAQINLSNDTLEAAKAVTRMMKAASSTSTSQKVLPTPPAGEEKSPSQAGVGDLDVGSVEGVQQ